MNSRATEFIMGLCPDTQEEPTEEQMLLAACFLQSSRMCSAAAASCAGRHNKDRVDKDALVHANLVTFFRFDAWVSAVAALTAIWQAMSRGGEHFTHS